jgi:hypothetical protein
MEIFTKAVGQQLKEVNKTTERGLLLIAETAVTR